MEPNYGPTARTNNGGARLLSAPFTIIHAFMAASSDDASVVLSSTLNPTKGFHTTSTTRFALRGSRADSCTLHLYLTLPAELFADPNELAHRRASYTFERIGGGNLEAPAFAPAAGGPSALLLDVNIPEGVDNVNRDQDDGNVFGIDVPLHARYGAPKGGGELIVDVMLPPPVAFWACPQEKGSGRGGMALTFHLILTLITCFSLQQNQCKYLMSYKLLLKMKLPRLS